MYQVQKTKIKNTKSNEETLYTATYENFEIETAFYLPFESKTNVQANVNIADCILLYAV
jgi:hypothetical protein